MEWHLLSLSEDQTRLIGEEIGKRLRPGDVIALWGTLGSGKTCLTQGIARGLGIAEEDVVSPTYTLIHEIIGSLRLFHIDLYRLTDPEDLEDIGFYEAFDGEGVAVIEWADRFHGVLPDKHMQIRLEPDRENESVRRITFVCSHPRYKELIKVLSTVIPPMLSSGQ
jgi:tRNA threonylcarbamoyladenosine biosynthesis protein TsaE